MPPFPSNALPSEFQEEHGSLELDGEVDNKATTTGPTHYDVDDEDLDIANADQRVWLCKLPKFVMESWSDGRQPGEILGRLRVFDDKNKDGSPRMAVILNPPTSSTNSDSSANPTDPPSATVADVKPTPPRPSSRSSTPALPTEYKLEMQNSQSKNMFIFGEREEEMEETGDVGHRKRRRITKLLGTVHHECSLQPELKASGAQEAYRAILRQRQQKAAAPSRTIKMLDVSAGEANRMASGSTLLGLKQRAQSFITPKAVGGRAAPGQAPVERLLRLPKGEVLDMLFPLFEQAPYWHAKTLAEHTKQPITYLKEVLTEVAILVRAGPYSGMWTLKPEYKEKGREQKKEDEAVKGEVGEMQTREAGGSGVGGGQVKGEEQGEDVKPYIGGVEAAEEEEEDEMVFEEVA